jgi:hypothetical protein
MNGRFHAVTPSNTRLEHMFDAMAHVLGFSYAFVDQVKNGNPVSHLFRKTVLPAYEQYLFSECPRLDQSNVSAILGNDYVTGVVTAIDPAWMKALFTDYFIRQGVTESQPAVHETAAPATEPVERVEDVAALVEGWDNAVRVRLIGEYRMADRRTRLWRVRTPA